MQLWHRHVRDTMVILEEGNLPHPQSSLCDMLVLWKALDGTHRCTEQCNQGEERKRRKLAAEEEKEVIDRDFSAYWRPLETATSFKYLGQVILAADNDWLAVMNNLSWARKVWSRIPGIISREGAAQRVSRFFFKSVVQAVLIFGADTWLVTPRMGKALGGFWNQTARRLKGHLPRRTPYRRWRYTLAAAARYEAGFLMMEEYIRRQQNTVAHYITMRSLLDLCEGS